MSSLKRDVIEVGQVRTSHARPPCCRPSRVAQGLAARKVREELDAMSTRRSSAQDDADDALEPSAHADPILAAAATEQEAAAAAAAAAAFAKGADTVGAAAVAAAAFAQGAGSAAAGDRAAARTGESVSTPAAASLNASEKREKEKLDKEKRTQARLQVDVTDVCDDVWRAIPLLTPITLTPITLTPITLTPITLTPITLTPITLTPITLTFITRLHLIFSHPSHFCLTLCVA
jgi:hypothetical protein